GWPPTNRGPHPARRRHSAATAPSPPPPSTPPHRPPATPSPCRRYPAPPPAHTGRPGPAFSSPWHSPTPFIRVACSFRHLAHQKAGTDGRVTTSQAPSE